MNQPANANGSGPKTRSGPSNYLLVGLAWFLLLMFALRVRTIEPIFLWVMTQGLLVEKLLSGHGGWWAARVLLFIAYMSAGLIAWAFVEKVNSDPKHAWRRAFVAWLGIQLIYCGLATALVQFGLLYE